MLGLYKLEYFKYFILSYTICLKLCCVGIVEEKIKITSKASAQVKYYVANCIHIIYLYDSDMKGAVKVH